MAYQQNIELDARCVIAAMQGGVMAMLAVALRNECPSPEEAVGRVEWLKKQSQDYVMMVCSKVDEMLPRGVTV